MPRLLRRHRKFLTSTVPGLWMLALFVGIANACRRDDVTKVSHQPTVAGQAVDYAMDDGKALGFDEFCSNCVSLFSVFELVHDQPTKQPLVVETMTSASYPFSRPFSAWRGQPLTTGRSVLAADRPA